MSGVSFDLEIDAVDPLWSTDHLSFHIEGGHLFTQAGGHLFHVRFPFHPFGRQHLGNFVVFLFVQMPEGQVVQLPLDLPYTQAVGQWRVDIQRFLSDAPSFLGGQRVQSTHIV